LSVGPPPFECFFFPPPTRLPFSLLLFPYADFGGSRPGDLPRHVMEQAPKAYSVLTMSSPFFSSTTDPHRRRGRFIENFHFPERSLRIHKHRPCSPDSPFLATFPLPSPELPDFSQRTEKILPFRDVPALLSYGFFFVALLHFPPTLFPHGDFSPIRGALVLSYDRLFSQFLGPRSPRS